MMEEMTSSLIQQNTSLIFVHIVYWNTLDCVRLH